MFRIPITFAPLLLLAIPFAAAETHKPNWEAGIAGADTITALAADRAGNVHATGAANDTLPLMNSVRRSNSGTDIAVSGDGGVTWKGLANLPTGRPGAHWTLVDTGLPMDGAGSAHIGYLAIDPFHPRTLIAGLGSKAYRSEDGALSWRDIDLLVPNGPYRSPDQPLAAFKPKRENVLYSFAWFSLYRRPNGGATWVKLAVPGSNVNAAMPDPVTAGVLYASSELGVYKSTDDGVTWTNIGPPETGWGDVVRLIAINPSNPAHGLIFSSKDSWRTIDGGASWTRMKLSRRAYAAAFGSNGRVVATAARSVDAFFVKRDATGVTALSCLFGGQGDDQTQALAVDGAGNLYVAGTTTSEDLDVGENAAQRAFGGGESDACVAKIASDGTLIWATYLGGAGADRAWAIAVAPDGSVAVAGYTASPDFAPAPGTPPQFVGQTFAARIAADGPRVLSAGRLGGWAGQDLGGIALDGSGNVWVAGTSLAADFPVTSDALKSAMTGYSDGFLAKVAPDGTLLYETYLGGNDWDTAAGVAVDSEGNVYVAGSTRSKDFATTEGAFHRELCSDCPYPSSCVATGFIGTICSYVNDDIFAMKLTPDGKRVLWSTLIGGGCFEEARGVAVGADASVYILGNSNSSPFPAKYPMESGPLYSAYKPVILRLDADGGALKFASNIGVGSVQTLSPDGLWYVGGAGGRISQLVPAEPPAISLDAIENAFRLTGGPVAPGELLRLTAPDLHPTEPGEYYLNPATPLPTEIGQTRVLFDGRAVPMMAALDGTAVVAAPFTLTPGGSVRVAVEHAVVRSNAVRMDVVPNDVGMLSADGSGRSQAYAQNADGRMNAPGNPASAGDLITVFFTGGGATTPASTEGVAAPHPAPGMAATVNVTIGSFGVRVEEAGTIPGFLTGLSYARVKVPNFPYGGAGVKTKISVWNADNSGYSNSQELTLSLR